MQRFLSYNPYWGDLNNVRLCVENVAALAYLLNRRLIISPKHRKFDEPTHDANGDYRPLDPHHFLNLSGVRLMDAAAVRADAETYHVPHFEPDTAVLVPGDDGPDLAAFAGGRSVIRLPAEAHEAQVISLPKLLTPFYAQIFVPKPTRQVMIDYVRDHVRHYGWADQRARRILDRLGEPFGAVTVRRNEFVRAYPQSDIAIGQIEEVIAERAPAGSLLVIATDETDRSFFRPLARRYRCLFARDLVTAECIAQPPMPSHWQLSCIEQNLCALAESYVGTRLSTFSAYPNRLRGYFSARDTSIRFTDRSHHEIRDDEGNPAFSWQATREHGQPLWAREFVEGIG
jgi:hypothetical protein